MREPLQPPRPLDVRESADDLLRRRISLVLWLVVVGNLLFAATDPWLNPGALWQLSLVKVGLIAVQLAGLALLRRRVARRVAVTIALLCGGVASAGGALAAVIVRDPFTTPLLCMSAALLTATIIPWGARVQLLVTAINLAAGAAAVYLIVGLPVAQAIVGMVVIAALSVYIARELARQRAAEAQATVALQRHHAEMARVLRVGTMGEMAAQLAHELTQPLGAIANYAAGCRRRMEATPGLPGEMVEVVDRIAHEALRAGAIIRRLREFLQKAAPQRAAVDINAVVRVVAEMIDAEARETDVAVDLLLHDGLPAVQADRIEIEQLLLNLARNGLEALHAGAGGAAPTLTIETRFLAPAAVEVLVRDTGPGLPDGFAAEIFEPFYTTKPGGLGMGLAISRTIVELHGGTLGATSGPHGTTFRVRLPIDPPPGVTPT